MGRAGKQLHLELDPKVDLSGLRVAGLFAGIGGVERGLHAAGHRTEFLCEINDAAQEVLRHRFRGVSLCSDVRTLKALPSVELVAAGFPCQDLSQAGRTAGIRGKRSGLVAEVFRLVDKALPTWVLLENVPFMLQLERGRAMRYLTQAFDQRGYRWAYRVVDTRAFGLPQRRRRVILLASRHEDPRSVLLSDDAGEPTPGDVWADRRPLEPLNGMACGFYWTEGTRGLGWAVDATPTLKGGSALGIPSPPAIVLPSRAIVTPDIRDAERLQGFPADWTLPAETNGAKRGARWRLIGNAVSVPVFRWVGRRLLEPREYTDDGDQRLERGEPWPHAAWSNKGVVYRSNVSRWPKRYKRKPLASFLRYPPDPLSARATAGFHSRAVASTLSFPDGFLEAVEAHLFKHTACAD